MMEVYSGTPGSGKSLHLAHLIRNYLRLGKRVISTCDIDTDLCFLNPFRVFWINRTGKKPKRIKRNKKADNFTFININEVKPDFLYEYAAKHHVFAKEHQTLLILDECVAIFSPTVISENIKLWNEWDTFFRKHRHIGYDVILVPQDKKLISRKVLYYCELETKHYNRKHHGFLGFLFSAFLGSFFSYTKFWRGTKDPLEQGFFTYKPIFGLMYNSYSMFDETLRPYKEAEKKKLMQEIANTLATYAKRQELPERQRLMSELCKNLMERRNQLEAIETNNGGNGCASDCG